MQDIIRWTATQTAAALAAKKVSVTEVTQAHLDRVGECEPYLRALVEPFAEQALDQARLELEQRVVDRTSKLEQSNQQLRHEIDERERIQEDLRRFKMTLDKTLDCVSRALTLHTLQIVSNWIGSGVYPKSGV